MKPEASISWGKSLLADTLGEQSRKNLGLVYAPAEPGALLLELQHPGHPCMPLTFGSYLPFTREHQGAKIHPAGHHAACPAGQPPAATRPKNK
jgi:hypothetical protein